jgi:hypothetical protein
MVGGTGYQPILGGNLPPKSSCRLVACSNGQVARSTWKIARRFNGGSLAQNALLPHRGG